MIDAIKVTDIKNQSLNPPKRPGKKPLKLLENNYRSINKAIQNNIKIFTQFSKAVA